VLSTEADRIISAIREDFKAVEATMMEEVRLLKEEFLGQLPARPNEVRSLREELGVLRETVAKLEDRVDDSDAYERRDTLVISGPGLPQVTATEVCSTLVCSLIKEKLKVKSSPY
jgi:hypothetical protein